MATYDKYTFDIPAYQEGNSADFDFDLSDGFPVADVTEISFQAREASGRLVMPEKTLANGITLAGLNVLIVFTAAEMTGIAGAHSYEIDFISAAGSFATIGGKFTVNRQINRR